jgi:hypothetical protein
MKSKALAAVAIAIALSANQAFAAISVPIAEKAIVSAVRVDVEVGKPKAPLIRVAPACANCRNDDDPFGRG